MANIKEREVWEDHIYQIETSDPVLGGENGIANRQAAQLGARTKYLKNEVEKRAPTNNPAFTGAPTAPTPEQSANNQQIATTAFVKAVVAALVGSSPVALDTLNELAAALGNDPNFSRTILNRLVQMQTAVDGKAAIVSPTFTGSPKAPTPAQTVNDTTLATTAFVKTAIATLVGSAPAELDTLEELAAMLAENGDLRRTLLQKIAEKAPLVHQHGIGEITGLQAALDQKNKNLNEKILDLTHLNPNHWYPLVMTMLNTHRRAYRFALRATLGESKPSWGTHAVGFGVYLDWEAFPSGWGAWMGYDQARVVHQFDMSHCSQSPVLKMGQMYEMSGEYIHLRGGARYTLYYEDEVVITFEGGDYNWQKEVSSSDVRRHHLPVLTNYDASLAPKTMRQALMDEIAANQISYQKIGDWDVRRYPDGTMIQTCRHRRGGAEFNRGHDDASNFVTLMYPLAFVESPTLTVTAQLSHPYAKDGLFTNDKSGRLGSGTVEANDGIVGLTVDCNNQQCQYTYTNGNTYISEMTFNITAIGRYKV